MKNFACLLALILCGCAGGPTHDFYKPVVLDAKFKGPVTIELVESLPLAKEKCLREGYAVVGTTAYFGKYPESNELETQAVNVGANYVIYSVKLMSGASRNSGLGFNNGGLAGSTAKGGANEVSVVFLGK